MNVELGPALVAGLVGGAAMVVLQLVGDRMRRESIFDLAGMWAMFLGLEGRRAVGVPVHLAVSAAVAVLYALAFRLAGAADAGWAWGLTASVIHWIIAGLFVGAAPGPARGDATAPGPFGMRLGAPTAVGFLAGHALYGLIVGLVYFALHSAAGIDAAL